MRLLLVLIGLMLTSSSYAQEYPTKPVRIVVPYPPGGVNDVLIRYISSKVSINNIIENRPGATGLVAARYVANEKPDGYTLLLGNITPNGVDPAWFFSPRSESKLSFEAIAMAGFFPQIMLAKTDAKDVIEKLKNEAAYGSYGIGGTAHISMFAIAPKGLHIPYKGGAETARAIASGEVLAGFVPGPVALAWIKRGDVKAVMSTSPLRHEPYGSIPTMQELGYNFTLTAWSGLMAPIGTPESVLDLWHSEIQEAIKDDPWFEANGLIVLQMSRQAFSVFVHLEKAKYRTLVNSMFREE